MAKILELHGIKIKPKRDYRGQSFALMTADWYLDDGDVIATRGAFLAFAGLGDLPRNKDVIDHADVWRAFLNIVGQYVR